MRKIILVVTVLMLFSSVTAYASTDSSTKPASEIESTYQPYQLHALEYLNSIREKLGLQKVKLNPYITKAAVNHANYIKVNNTEGTGLSIHYEAEEDPAFTGNSSYDRVKFVGGNQNVGEVISFHADIEESIDSLISGPYHRIALLSPSATEIGVGIVDSIAVININNNNRNHGVFALYPYDGQENVDIGFYGNEIPNPLNDFHVQKSGFIISFIPPEDDFRSIRAKITDSQGGEIPFYQIGTTYLLPAYELAYDEQYTVSMDYITKSKKQNKTWSFRTKKSPLTVGSKQNILVKINHKFVPLSETSPIIQKGNIYVPLKGILERLNAEVIWDKTNKMIVVTKSDKKIEINTGNNTAVVNGKAIPLEQPLEVIYDTTYVPLRFISESIGAKVDWDDKNNIVNISVPTGKAVDVMAKLFVESKEKIEGKLNKVFDIGKKYGYRLEEQQLSPDYSGSVYTIYDNNGDQFAEFYLSIYEDQEVEYSSTIRTVPLVVLQTDQSKFEFLQEVVESLSGNSTNDLSKILYDISRSQPSSKQNESKRLEINSTVTCELLYMQDYRNDIDNTWEMTVKIETK